MFARTTLMQKRSLLRVCAVLFFFSPVLRAVEAPRPKLIVAILVDQLRYDYLVRFHERFSDGGFRLLTDRGAFMTSAKFDYCPTVTGPGHASVFSGAPPSMHGIIGNDWFDRRTRKTVYCCADPAVTGVGTAGSEGKMSPRNFIGDNFADELRLRFNSRVVGISMKDRGAILPAGKKPLGAFWFEAASGNFVTSSYYMADLPAWVKAFNERALPSKLAGQKWERLLDEKLYEREDDAPGEGLLPGEKKPIFPHVIARSLPPATAPGAGKSAASAVSARGGAITKIVPPRATPAPPATESFENLLATPFSNQILGEFARAAIEGEKLGDGPGPDLLTLSFSAVDAAGHRYGPYSQEVEDIVLRLDRQLADLFAYLDKRFGLENVWITLTADHAVMPTPEFAALQGLDAQRIDDVTLLGDLLARLSQRFGSSNLLLTRGIYDSQLYFNPDVLREKNLAASEVVAAIREWALSTGKYHAVYSREQLLDGRVPGPFGQRVVAGYNAERGGDVFLLAKPYLIDYGGKTGTTHGSPYNYDTHVPVLFHGAAFRAGRYAEPFGITDFVPTLCAALRMSEPAMCVGRPCVEVLASGEGAETKK